MLIYKDNSQVLLCGGIIDGRLNFLSEKKGVKLSSLKLHLETITSISIDAKERILITGSIIGDCRVWIIRQNLGLDLKFDIFDHEREVLNKKIVIYK